MAAKSLENCGPGWWGEPGRAPGSWSGRRHCSGSPLREESSAESNPGFPAEPCRGGRLDQHPPPKAGQRRVNRQEKAGRSPGLWVPNSLRLTVRLGVARVRLGTGRFGGAVQSHWKPWRGWASLPWKILIILPSPRSQTAGTEGDLTPDVPGPVQWTELAFD